MSETETIFDIRNLIIIGELHIENRALRKSLESCREELEKWRGEAEALRRHYVVGNESQVDAAPRQDPEESSAPGAVLNKVREILRCGPDTNVIEQAEFFMDKYKHITGKLQEIIQEFHIGLGGDRLEDIIDEYIRKYKLDSDRLRAAEELQLVFKPGQTKGWIWESIDGNTVSIGFNTLNECIDHAIQYLGRKPEGENAVD